MHPSYWVVTVEKLDNIIECIVWNDKTAQWVKQLAAKPVHYRKVFSLSKHAMVCAHGHTHIQIQRRNENTKLNCLMYYINTRLAFYSTAHPFLQSRDHLAFYSDLSSSRLYLLQVRRLYIFLKQVRKLISQCDISRALQLFSSSS